MPVLGRSAAALRPDRELAFAVKAFEVGVILATGMVHILPAAFPYPGLVAMTAALATMMVDSVAAGYYRQSHFKKARPVDDAYGVRARDEEGGAEHAGHVHVHVHGEALAAGSPEEALVGETIRHRVASQVRAVSWRPPRTLELNEFLIIAYQGKVQVLELGILVHSVTIGVSLGASLRPSSIRPLIGALSFHQFFEGVGLGKFQGESNRDHGDLLLPHSSHRGYVGDRNHVQLQKESSTQPRQGF